MTRLSLATALLFCALLAAVGVSGTIAAPQPSQEEIQRAAGELLARTYRGPGPGAAVLVARGDTVLFRAARGEADIDKHIPLKPESVFRIGSVTKQFSAAGLLKLVEAGKVKLDDRLTKYVPGYPGGDRITVRQLLNHTSGVKNYTDIGGYMDGPIRRDLTTAQMIDVFKNAPPDFTPGSKWAYSNSGYVLVGAIIEAASGKPWHVYLDEALFKPLGMTRTGYGHDVKFAAQQVRGYSGVAGSVVPMKPLSMTQPHAAGALVSTVDDLLIWNRALHEGRVLQSTTYAQMITPAGAAAEGNIRYGFGLFERKLRNHDALCHPGGIFGFISTLCYLPGPDITVAVLENDDGSGSGNNLMRKLAAIGLGEPYPEMKGVAIDATAIKAAEGVYRFGPDVTRVLRVVDGKLTAQRGNSPRVVLTPIAIDDFLYPDGFNRLKLERDAGGKISGIRFFANGDGEGEFGKRTNEPLPSAPVAMQVPRAALERLVGKFANNELSVTIFLEGDALKAQIVGQPPVGLRATSTTKFDVQEADASLEFSPGDKPAAELTIRQNGQVTVLKRP